jgi:NADPH-dependent 2,4-dienoyl-CoA reductase/sulfur reductase-like enzyme
MAPVAGGIANTYDDGLIFFLGFFEGFFTPGIPVHRVIGMLEKIRTGGMGKTVLHVFAGFTGYEANQGPEDQ